MREGRMRTHFYAILLSALVALGSPAGVYGVNITRCDDVCDSNCTVQEPLNCCSSLLPQCDGLGPIVVSNGADLNLNGKTINCYCGTTTCVGGSNNNAECAGPSDCDSGVCQNATGCSECGTAIRIDSNSSTIKNVGSVVGTIKGSFATGVDCQSKTSSGVTGIRFEDLGAIGLLNCAQVDGNVMIGGEGTAIKSSGVADSDYIRDNYIAGWYGTGVYRSGNKDVSVDHNMIVMESRTTRTTFFEGIHINTFETWGTAQEIKANILHGVGFIEDPECFFCLFNPLVVAEGPAWSDVVAEDNICDPAVAACGQCIAEGLCREVEAPYELP